MESTFLTSMLFIGHEHNTNSPAWRITGYAVSRAFRFETKRQFPIFIDVI